MTPSFRQRRAVVVVGGGIAGASTAYHLTKLGITDVMLLEQGQAHVRHHVARRRTRRPDARDTATLRG